MREKAWYDKNRFRLKKGYPERELGGSSYLMEELRESEWSPEFEDLMHHRLCFGAIRYGRLHAKGKPKYDRVQSMIKRLVNYRYSGNKEFLVDIANLCLLEFEECDHPKAHFTSIDDGEHVLETSKSEPLISFTESELIQFIKDCRNYHRYPSTRVKEVTAEVVTKWREEYGTKRH